MSGPNRLRAFLNEEATRLGFEAVAIARPTLADGVKPNFQTWIDRGHHGSMEWMAETFERRADPGVLWPDARSAIMLAMNYAPDHDPLDVLAQPHKGCISIDARHRDYHDVIKGRLKELAQKLLSRAGEAGAEVKVFVDTAPVMEKPLAHQAGLGWQGKHTNLVSRELGSWFFLGAIFTSLDLEADQAEIDHCGSCRACLDVCPTDAFPAAYQLDARRCISYLTIENKGPIPIQYRKAMGNRIYGCDDCLAACPWNKFAQSAQEAKLREPDGWVNPLLEDLLALDDADFRRRFSGSPVKRIGRNRFIRNCLIAAGNSGLTYLVSKIEPHLLDADPVVRGSAVWALGQLVADGRSTYANVRENENDPSVLEEWNAMPGQT